MWLARQGMSAVWSDPQLSLERPEWSGGGPVTELSCVGGSRLSVNKGLGNNVHLFESKVTLLHYIIGTKDFAKENLQRDSEIFNKPRKVCGFEYTIT